jgi:hypothetical protein
MTHFINICEYFENYYTGQTSRAAANSTFAIGGVSCSADTFVVAESSVLRINICGKSPAHRKSAKRCVSFAKKIHLRFMETRLTVNHI